jgi:hypothetical protein
MKHAMKKALKNKSHTIALHFHIGGKDGTDQNKENIELGKAPEVLDEGAGKVADLPVGAGNRQLVSAEGQPHQELPGEVGDSPQEEASESPQEIAQEMADLEAASSQFAGNEQKPPNSLDRKASAKMQAALAMKNKGKYA